MTKCTCGSSMEYDGDIAHYVDCAIVQKKLEENTYEGLIPPNL